MNEFAQEFKTFTSKISARSGVPLTEQEENFILINFIRMKLGLDPISKEGNSKRKTNRRREHED